jgi:hypothetical protein
MKICKLRDGGQGCGTPRGYRIQSSQPVWGPLWPHPGENQLTVDHRCAAIALAAKSHTSPGGVIEVVHVASGEVVFRKLPEPASVVPSP